MEIYSLWRRANARNVSFFTLYGGQFTFSTQSLTLNYLPYTPPTQHHSFFRNLPPLLRLPAVANIQWNWTVHQMYKQRTDNRVPGNPDRLLRSYDYLVVKHVSHMRRTAALNFDYMPAVFPQNAFVVFRINFMSGFNAVSASCPLSRPRWAEAASCYLFSNVTPNFCLRYCYISFYLIQSWSIIRAILVLNANNALTKRILSALSRSCLEVAESRSY